MLESVSMINSILNLIGLSLVNMVVGGIITEYLRSKGYTLKIPSRKKKLKESKEEVRSFISEIISEMAINYKQFDIDSDSNRVKISYTLDGESKPKFIIEMDKNDKLTLSSNIPKVNSEEYKELVKACNDLRAKQITSGLKWLEGVGDYGIDNS